MAKQLIDLLDDYFARELRNATNRIEAYESAVEKFERDRGVSAPPSYDAFRKRKERKRRRH